MNDELDDLIGKGRGDPDLPSGGKWIGIDLPKTKFTIEPWDFPSWHESDNSPNSPLEADWDDNYTDAYGNEYKETL